MTYKELMQLPEKVVLEGSFMLGEVYVDQFRLPLEPSLKVSNHSPDGFSWGYGGSGPAQFALALLMLYLPKELALQYYQAFKWGFIAALPKTDFIKTVNLRQVFIDSVKATT